MTRALLFLVSCVFTHNFVFSRMLGTGALLDRDRSIEAAALLGLVVTAVMTVSAAINWVLDALILKSLNAAFLQNVVFVLVVALTVVAAEQLLGKKYPGASGHAELLTAGCALLGASLVNAQAGAGFVEAVLGGLFGGLGLLVALVLMAGVHERIRFSHIPEPLKGFPITLISASLMALAFMGFMGIA